MKFLIDNALSPVISEILKEHGFDSVHVRDYNMQDSDDKSIFFRAKNEDRIIISADTDFGTLLALWNYSKPSVILFRRLLTRDPIKQAEILLSNFSQIQNDLENGSVIIIEQNRIRIRRLPILS
jgi:predicted nuclease of predicted toxin-antitoxin system